MIHDIASDMSLPVSLCITMAPSSTTEIDFGSNLFVVVSPFSSIVGMLLMGSLSHTYNRSLLSPLNGFGSSKIAAFTTRSGIQTKKCKTNNLTFCF